MPLPRLCRICEERYQPKGRSSRLCPVCRYKSKRDPFSKEEVS